MVIYWIYGMIIQYELLNMATCIFVCISIDTVNTKKLQRKHDSLTTLALPYGATHWSMIHVTIYFNDFYSFKLTLSVSKQQNYLRYADCDEYRKKYIH